MTFHATLNPSNSGHGRQRERRDDTGGLFASVAVGVLRRVMAMNNEALPKQATGGKHPGAY